MSHWDQEEFCLPARPDHQQTGQLGPIVGADWSAERQDHQRRLRSHLLTCARFQVPPTSPLTQPSLDLIDAALQQSEIVREERINGAAPEMQSGLQGSRAHACGIHRTHPLRCAMLIANIPIDP
ncbi:hypothetical protein AAFF_G00363610 [Aldrovandia affinis]|uniref:Uncharacterized protein n=1 Tax=Aldrovandia affinis TaxID=143900 RepID=A0AAD7WNN2_9TELE|nr:hypothetical protein AAFF_G00363610 [Aldrovandia affinis]